MPTRLRACFPIAKMTSRALIIGGTGMLAGASRLIAARYDQTILAARHPQTLAAEIGATPWAMNWADQCSGLSTLVPMPEFDLVLAWLHVDGLWLAEHLHSKLADGGRFVHVHGSAALDPAVLSRRAVAGAGVQNVILGRKGGRWLSKAEIGAGVMAALDAPFAPRVVIGS